MTQVICANCTNNWESDVVSKVCSSCNSTDIVVSYGRINEKQLKYLQKNIEAGTTFVWQCGDCGSTKELFSDNLYNVHCTNGCTSLMVVTGNRQDQQEIISQLKAYRKKKHYNQSIMAYTLGLSQSKYSRMEQGKLEIPASVIKRITTLK